MIKTLIYFLLSLVLIVVLAVGALVVFVNPNDFKPLIVKEAKKATGRDLVIDGNISWSFWPNLGVSIENVALSNPEGFAEKNLLQFDKAELSVSVLPLVSKSVDVNLVRLHGARFFMQTLMDGSNNLEGLTASSETASSETTSSETDSAASSGAADTSPPTEPPQPKSENTSSWQIAVGEIDIQNAGALILDDQAGTASEINNLNLSVGTFAFETWVPVKFSANGKQNSLDFNVDGTTEIKLATIIEQSQLRELTLKATLKDQTQNLEVNSLSFGADQLGLAISSALAFNVKGRSQDLAFDSSGKLTLYVDEKIELIDIKNIDLAANLTGKSLPKEAMKVVLGGDLKFDNKAQRLDASDIALAADDIKVTGKANVQLAEIPKVRFDFKSQEINLDTFLGLAQAPSTEVPSEAKSPTTAPTKKEPLSDVEPDLSALKGLDIAGKIVINKFIAGNVNVSDVVTEFMVASGKAKLSRFDAKLYQGTVSAAGELDATVTPARYKISKRMKNVEIQPLLIDAADQKILAGKGDIQINLQGVGLSPLLMRTGLTGTISTSLTDGAIYGINIPQVLREAKAAIKGEKANLKTEESKTDFAAFQATFNLAKGVASTKNMSLQSPAIRIKNTGSTNLVDESMNFLVFASVVETSKGQGAEDMDDLKGITVPINISGTWHSPAYGLDVKRLLTSNKIIQEKLQGKVEKELNKLLGDKDDDDPVKQITNELFNQFFK